MNDFDQAWTRLQGYVTAAGRMGANVDDERLHTVIVTIDGEEFEGRLLRSDLMAVLGWSLRAVEALEEIRDADWQESHPPRGPRDIASEALLGYNGSLTSATTDRHSQAPQDRVDRALALIDRAMSTDTSELTAGLPTPSQRLYAEGLSDGIRLALERLVAVLRP